MEPDLNTQTVEESLTKSKRSCQQYEVVVKPTQWSIIYSSEYNIGFCGLEKLHPFDSGKWGKIFEFLKVAGMLREDTVVEPMEATEEDLLLVHSNKYLRSLKLANIVEGMNEWSINVAGITEVPPVALLPNFIVQKKVLRPFRFQTSGTIMGGKLAIERGWAINIGGGYHHCSANRGGGFCAYADITLSIQYAFQNFNISKAMIIDLDAHQGNGHERDFMDNNKVYILDIFNRDIYPHDGFAKRAIKRKVEIGCFTDNEKYLKLVERHVEGALNEFTPDLVVYNAGTDILEGDPLGLLSITAEGIIQRDEIVFTKCRSRNIPIVMVTSGGYLRETARIVANSILNLRHKSLISCTEAEQAGLIEPDDFDHFGTPI
ncbi:histone deacetylase 11 isoform X3 [Biomphalaria pfeifferi]|uniref:Histone deacetylase 11 n=1 Tax=Biomphalaria pfeifferi TaxID=112525 RepID=A0AAD8B9R0_BIOPF|nr:histone deacetylase 11 isoform X3 [Biomphalaria pfeifferi]